MEKLKFNIDINAPKEKVWKALWSDQTYPKWTSVFSEGSIAKTDWKEGSKVQFLSGNNDGMYSKIAKNIPNQYMSFEHIGVIKEGKELPLDEETKKWSGSKENYTLSGSGDITKLEVDMDAVEEYSDYFKKTFPNALQKVKEISED